MTTQVLISMTSDELRDLMAQAVAQGIREGSKNRVPLRPMEEARMLDVSFNTYKKMLAITGRTEIYPDEIETFKIEYYGTKKLQSKKQKRIGEG